MSERNHIRFLLNDQVCEIADLDPNLTLLRYLREQEKLTGTKEGCAEGDCGACTVAVGEIIAGQIQYRAVNACILFLGMLDGKHILTVEHLRSANGDLHPAQQAMVDNHGSQCGYCTPGFVMSLFTMYRDGGQTSRQQIDDSLAGNLCRCTGYGPIIDSATTMLTQDENTEWPERLTSAAAQLQAWHNDQVMLRYQCALGSYLAPRSLGELQIALKDNAKATILAGATDVGLWVTKMGRRLDPLIDITRIEALHQINETPDTLTIGSAVRYSDVNDLLTAKFPELGELVRRIGATQVRNSGTIGGNIANGSPIGDTPPALIALNASITLNKQGIRRTIALEEFYIDYGKQDRAADEFLETIHIPLTDQGDFRCHKLSKRFDQDITATLGAFNVKVIDGRVQSARIAFGGMAATPKRATACEAALLGQGWDETTVEIACTALADDFTPLSDMRASADYRLGAAQNLLRKYYLESQAATPIRLSLRGNAA